MVPGFRGTEKGQLSLSGVRRGEGPGQIVVALARALDILRVGNRFGAEECRIPFVFYNVVPAAFGKWNKTGLDGKSGSESPVNKPHDGLDKREGSFRRPRFSEEELRRSWIWDAL